MMKELVFAQAALLAGEMSLQRRELLRVLCNAWTASLAARLKEGVTAESCQEEFVAAASLYALADWKTAEEAAFVEEFRAGDLTVRQGGGAGAGSAAALQKQAGMLMAPYLKDGFAFLGV